MEFFGDESDFSDIWPTLHKLQKQAQLSPSRLTLIMKEILEAFIFMHKKKILHNDIKADNVLIGQNRSVIIDFGKATMLDCPVIYNVALNADQCNIYNKKHRHLAHELRNVPNTKQSTKTDAYSIGYMMKHVGAAIPFPPIIRTGKNA